MKDIKCSRCMKWRKTYMTYSQEEIDSYKCGLGDCFEMGIKKNLRSYKDKAHNRGGIIL